MAGAFTELEIDRAGQNRGLWARRVVIALFCVIALLALADRFGQRPTESQAASPAARMTLTAPDTVRGGLFFQSRVEIHALREIAAPQLVLDHGWVEGMQVNSIEPAPASELSRDGRVVLTYDKLAPGDDLRDLVPVRGQPHQRGPPLLRHRARRREPRAWSGSPRPSRTCPRAMDLVVRAIFVFFLMLVITRAVGRRELTRSSRST